jgi:hypothetical protein
MSYNMRCINIRRYLSTHCWFLYRNAAVRWDPKSLFLFNFQLEHQGIFEHDVNKPLKQS